MSGELTRDFRASLDEYGAQWRSAAAVTMSVVEFHANIAKVIEGEVEYRYATSKDYKFDNGAALVVLKPVNVRSAVEYRTNTAAQRQAYKEHIGAEHICENHVHLYHDPIQFSAEEYYLGVERLLVGSQETDPETGAVTFAPDENGILLFAERTAARKALAREFWFHGSDDDLEASQQDMAVSSTAPRLVA